MPETTAIAPLDYAQDWVTGHGWLVTLAVRPLLIAEVCVEVWSPDGAPAISFFVRHGDLPAGPNYADALAQYAATALVPAYVAYRWRDQVDELRLSTANALAEAVAPEVLRAMVAATVALERTRVAQILDNTADLPTDPPPAPWLVEHVESWTARADQLRRQEALETLPTPQLRADARALHAAGFAGTCEDLHVLLDGLSDIA